MLQRKSLLLGLSLVLVTAAVYARVGEYGFVNLDDPLFVSENPVVARGLTREGVVWAFRNFSGGSWHPLTWISHMADVELFGVSDGPHHLVNLFLHLVNVLLLFNLLGAMTGAAGRSALAAALFAVHPLHVESVAWIAERKDLLSTCLLLLSLRAWIGHLRRPRASRYLAGLAFYAFSLMAKPMPVSLPLLLLLLDYWPLGRALRGGGGDTRPRMSSLVREKAPLVVLALAAGVLALVSQSSAGALTSLERLPAGVRVAQAFHGYLWYLGKALWPSGLAVLYPHPGTAPSLGATAAVACALLLATGFALGRARKLPYLATGWLWYLVALTPVVGLVQAGAQSVADRYSYLPLVGIFVFASWGFGRLAAATPRARAIFPAAAVGALLAFGVCAGRQAEFWRDSERLLVRAASVTRGNWVAYTNLGVTYERAGRIAAAVEAYRKAIAVGPGSATPYTNLGVLLGRSGDEEAALALFRRATAVQPEDSVAWLNLGVSLNRLGRHAEALGAFRQAVAVKPDYAEAYNKLGSTLVRTGAIAEAASVRQALARLDPQAAARLGETIESAARGRRLP